MAQPARLAIHNLDKSFGDTKVLDKVDLTIRPGEVHGLAGQNGSGKSTLIKIVTGVYTPNAGSELHIDGHSVRLPVRWPEAHTAGVSVVHQDLGLLDELSVADNVCVGGFPSQRVTRRIDRTAQLELARSALNRIGAVLDPRQRTSTLSAPQRAEVAIARALRDHRPGVGLVIMDESTRSLTGTDLARVHDILRALAAEGTSVLLISHSLPELLEVTDRVTVLRDGKVTGAGLATADLSEHEIARRMLGSAALGAELEPRYQQGGPAAQHEQEPAITVRGLSGQRVRDVSLDVDQGEIVGITGLPGSGYEEIPYLLSGASRAVRGQLTVGTRKLDLSHTTVARCLRAGVMLVPEQRAQHGIAGELSVQDNITLPSLRRHGRRWFLGQSWQREYATAATRRFSIRPADPDRLVKTLSGGNQQKVLLAKWLGAAPALLVLHEPTQAVDVSARRDILLAIRHAAAQGVSVVLVTGEPTDICAICDRVYVAEIAGGVQEVQVTTADELLERVYDKKAG